MTALGTAAAGTAWAATSGEYHRLKENHVNVFDNQYRAPGPICPECRDGKHRNCDGTAWDETTDQITNCTCTHEGA